jgi:RHS repeat-associated protein
MIYSEVTDLIGNSRATAVYKYDAYGRRTVTEDGSAEESGVMRTLYDGFSFEAVREGATFRSGGFTTNYTSSAALIAPTNSTEGSRYRYITDEDSADDSKYRNTGDNASATERYTGINVTLYGRGEAVAMNRTSSDGVRSGAAYLGKDILGSVRSVSNDYGNLEDRYEYDAFGKPYKGDLESGMNLGYTGKPYDAMTGLYNYGYRDYKPEAARFTTVDPIRDGSNWFAYVNGDPVNWVDLWGLEAKEPDAEIAFTIPLPMFAVPDILYTPTGLTPVFANQDGTVFRSGWQNPNDTTAGMGWRTSIDRGDGYYDQYGHLTPTSTLPTGTYVTAGTYIGTVANPTNGDSTGPHVHKETRQSKDGKAVNPGTDSPFAGESTVTSGYSSQEPGIHDVPHQGVDHVLPR